MAITDRKFSSGILSWTVNVQDFSTRIKNGEITREYGTVQNEAVLDTYEYESVQRLRQEITFEEAVEGAGALEAVLGTEIAFSINDGVETIAGNGLLTRINRSYPDGGMTRGYRLGPRSLWTIT